MQSPFRVDRRGNARVAPYTAWSREVGGGMSGYGDWATAGVRNRELEDSAVPASMLGMSSTAVHQPSRHLRWPVAPCFMTSKTMHY